MIFLTSQSLSAFFRDYSMSASSILFLFGNFADVFDAFFVCGTVNDGICSSPRDMLVSGLNVRGGGDETGEVGNCELFCCSVRFLLLCSVY